MCWNQMGGELMPVYEYKCKDCNSETVKFRSISKRHDETKCDVCGGPAFLKPSVANTSYKCKGLLDK